MSQNFDRYGDLLNRVQQQYIDSDDQRVVDYWCSHYMALWDLCWGRMPRFLCVDGRAVLRRVGGGGAL